MLATRSTTRIVAHERPDLIEVGSAWCAPWLVHLATRGLRVPAGLVLPQQLPPDHRPSAARGGLGPARPPARWPGATCAGSAEWSRPPSRPAARWRGSWRAPASRTWSTCRSASISIASTPRAATAPPRRAGTSGCRRGRSRSTSAGSRRRRISTCCWRAGWRSSAAPAPAWCWSAPVPPRDSLAAEQGRRAAPSGFPTSATAICSPISTRAVDLVVAPGSAETFGLAALEALASGIPVLSADRGGVAETCRCPGAGRLYASRRSGAPRRRRPIRLLGEDLPALGRARPALRRGASRLGYGVRPPVPGLPHACSPGEPAGLHSRRHSRAGGGTSCACGRCAPREASRRPCWWCRTGTESGRSSGIAGFVRWLRERAGRRRRDRPPRGAPRAEASSAMLDRSAARERIDRGLGIAAVARPRSRPASCRPQWLAREDGHAAVGDAGLGFSEDDRTHPSLPGRPADRVARRAVERAHGGRAWGSVAVARARWLLQRRARVSPARVSPAGLRPPAHRPGSARRRSTVADPPSSRPGTRTLRFAPDGRCRRP